jgi:chemotaxis protein MotB
MRTREWRLQREGEEENASADRDRWLVTYADLITLLMIFFVVMYALSSRISADNFSKIQKSLKSSLHTKKKEGKDIFANIPTQVKSDQMQEAQMRVKQAIAQFDGKSSVRVDLQARGLVISLYDTAFFEANSADLKPAMQQALMKVSTALATMSNAISVEGHSDNIPPGGKYSSNWILAAERAAKVVEFMSRQGRITPKRLSVTSYAEYRPLFPNDTPEHRALNRRVDLVVSNEGPKAAITPTPTPESDLMFAPYGGQMNKTPAPGQINNPFGEGGLQNPFGQNY